MTVTDSVASLVATPRSIRPAIIAHGINKGRETNTVFHVTAADGSEYHLCADCSFRHKDMWPVLCHRGKHAARKSATEKKQLSTSVEELTERAIAAMTAAINAGLSAAPDIEATTAALTADRDEWKRRAKDAERKLATMRRALGVSD